jgi:ABC-type transport system substrate-binding protein
MNLAVPPFDDVHVRKAVNYVVDKDALLRIRGGPSAGRVIGHVVLDSLEDDLLRNYDPYGPNHSGNVTMARGEMRKSHYDHDGDGRCDDPACRGVLALVFESVIGGDAPIFSKSAHVIATDLSKIGIDLNVQALQPPEVFARIADPSNRVPMALSIAWGKGLPSATSIVPDIYSGQAVGKNKLNYSLVGASPAQLRQWGYKNHSVPNVDGRIKTCVSAVGQEQVQCWAGVDQYVTEKVVPQVPYLVETNSTILSSRVVASSFDQSTSVPALDRFAVRD